MNAADPSGAALTKGRKRLPPQERERQLLAGAIDYVAEHGFAFSTRDLAGHLGVSQSLLFRYFATKEDLFDKIYQHVYLNRWNPAWDDMLLDRAMPFEARLERYLVDYARVVLSKDWVRIFLLSSFENPVISQRYIDMLQRRIFDPWLDEQLHAMGLGPIPDPEDRAMALELIWGFHSSVFYLGVRKWVYRMPAKAEIEDIIRRRLHAFLPGFQSYLRSVAADPAAPARRAEG